MQIDTDRWQRLRRAEADAVDDGPSVLQVQDANDRRARVRDELARFKASGPQGLATGRPTARAHVGVEIKAGFGGHDPEGVTRAFDRDVRELEARVAEAEREAARLAERLHQCSQRRFALQRLMEDVRRWATEQSPPVILPGDSVGSPPVVTLRGAPPGTRDLLGRPA